MIMRTSSGEERNRMELMMALMQTDLPLPGLTGDEQMRHLGQIADDGASRDVASQRHGQG